MNQKKLLAASVAAACLAMTTCALAADYSNRTETADGTALAGHLHSTSDAINSTNDTFENNKLTFTATGGLTTAAGIAAFHTSVTVTDGTFTSNEVSDSDGSINGVYGTAVGVSGADGSSALTITNSTFTSNKGTSYNQTEGGAIYQSIGTATIKGSRFDQNVAETAKEPTKNNASAMGGAVSLWGTTTVIEDSTFTNNSTASHAEKGSSLGGALYLRSGVWGGAENLSASIKNSTFEGNSVKGSGALGGALYAKSDYDSEKDKHYILNLDLDNVTFKNNTSASWGGAMFVQGEGSLTMKDVTFEGNQGVYGSALAVYGNKPYESSLDKVKPVEVTATNVNYLNNVSNGYGAALWLYTETQYNQTGGSFVGNKTTGSSNLLGAVFVKGADAVFTDVLFQNNTVESSDGIAAGGAVYVDIVKNGEAGVVGGSVKFIATKDMTYSGNNVTGKDIPVNTYGSKTTTAGGFLLLDRGTSAEFTVDEGATLTIGEDGSTGNMDSIASAYPESVDQSVASIKKTGSGTLVINSDMNRYYGTVDVQAGRMEVNTTWSLREAATISGGTLALKAFNFDKMPDPLSTVGSITVKNGGTLETASAQLFKNGLGDGSVTDAGDALKADKVTVEEGGTIALNDAVYNLDYASSLGNKYTNAKYVLLGQLSDASKDDLAQQDKVTLDDVAMVGENIVLNEVKITSEDKNVQIGGTQLNDYAYRGESLAVASFDLGTANQVLIDGGKTLTLTGEGAGSELLKTSGTDKVGVTVKAESTLLLGGTDYAKGGTLAGTVTVESNGTLTATGGEIFTVDAIDGAGTVLVGEDKTAGKLTITQLAENFTGTIFVDPAWKDDETLNVIGNASHLEISKVDTAITGTLAAGRNSLITLGADAAEASSAFEAIASVQGLSWGEKNVTAALYLGAPIEVAGKIVVDGSLTDAASAATYNNNATVYVADQGILIVSQSLGSSDTSMITGTLSVADGSYIGVTNASEGTFKLADTITGTTEVVTDNPFIEGEISTADGTLTNTLNADSGLSALASLGIQSMARRADFTLSETIADRTAIDQQLHAGVNLWADVSGERYEADGLAHGAEFKADMGYAAFGGDIALGQDYTVGAAFQYGKGTLRSAVSSIRNEIDSYGFALYGAKDFGAAKVVAEASYLWTENDITASQTALNQSVDANVWSVGIRGQHAFKAGAFTFTPSVGVRYSHLETDAMTIGAVNVEKQKQDLIQVPLALRVTAGETNAAGWQLAPFFKVAYVPTFGDKEIEVLSHETDVIDTNPVQSAFGLRAQNGNLLLNADFTVGGGKDGTSSVGGKIGVKYAF